MGLVKQATKTFNKLMGRGVVPTAAPAASSLKDALKDNLKADLEAQPKLEPASSRDTKSSQARAESKGPNLSALVEDARDAVIDTGGTDIHTFEAFAETVSKVLGDEAVAGARKSLMMEVKAADKRVARSFSDTVKGHGGAAWSTDHAASGAQDEEEEEEEVTSKKPKAKKPKAKVAKAKAEPKADDGA